MTVRPRIFVRLTATLVFALAVTARAALARAAEAAPAPAIAAGRPYQPPSACRLPPDSAGLKEGFPVSGEALPARGRLRAAAIFVDLPDAPAAPRTLKAARDQLRSSLDYLDTVSRGALRVTVRQSATWVRMPRPAEGYHLGERPTYQDHVRYIRDAIRAADPSFDFSGIDVVWVSSTPEATAMGNGAATSLLDVTADGTHLTHAVTMGYTQYIGTGLVLAHETGHTLGLPDLYPYANGTVDDTTGPWDLMGDVFGLSPEMFAWHRYRLGWLYNSEVACLSGTSPATLRLSAVETGHGTAMAVLPIGPWRAIVVESRRAQRLDGQTLYPGVLIYVVDTTVPSGYRPITVADTTPDSTHFHYDATLTQGRTWTDVNTGTTVTVRASSKTGDLVTIVPGRRRP